MVYNMISYNDRLAYNRYKLAKRNNLIQSILVYSVLIVLLLCTAI